MINEKNKNIPFLLLLISNIAFAQNFTDTRDGKVYGTVEIGRTTWFTQNLNYDFKGSFCYDNKEENCNKFGRLYRWEDAIKACPDGWHLSTEYDWQYLEQQLGMAVEELLYRGNRGTNEGAKMKPGGSSGLNIFYAGYRRRNGEFARIGTNAALWTSTDADFAHAWHRDIDQGDEFSFRSRVVKDYALSCRCVKNNYAEDSKDN